MNIVVRNSFRRRFHVSRLNRNDSPPNIPTTPNSTSNESSSGGTIKLVLFGTSLAMGAGTAFILTNPNLLPSEYQSQVESFKSGAREVIGAVKGVTSSVDSAFRPWIDATADAVSPAVKFVKAKVLGDDATIGNEKKKVVEEKKALEEKKKVVEEKKVKAVLEKEPKVATDIPVVS